MSKIMSASIPLERVVLKQWVNRRNPNIINYFKYVDIEFRDIRMHYVHLDDTINMDALRTGDFTLYNEYVASAGQKDHNETKFKAIADNFSVAAMPRIPVYFDCKYFMPRDGLHRLCILRHKGYLKGDVIPLKYIDMLYDDIVINNIGKLLEDSTKIYHASNGWQNKTRYGYHSFNLHNINFQGQRNPKQRLSKLEGHYDFEGKTVIDVGGNNGGMLFHLMEKIKRGVCADFDANCIAAGIGIKRELNLNLNLDFYQRNLEVDTMTDIYETEKPDIIFLLSIGSWIKRWREVYLDAARHARHILLETNNDREGEPQLKLFSDLGATIKLVSDKSDDDITGNHLRKTYLIEMPIMPN